MPQSLAKVYLHIIFSTKNRRPLLDEAIQPELQTYLASVLRNSGCSPIAIGAVADHIHILCSLPRDLSIASLVAEVKVASSKWIKRKGISFAKFGWQTGYSVFSVSQSGLHQAVKYIHAQQAHHRRRTFKEELLEFLKRYEVEFDEKYLWD